MRIDQIVILDIGQLYTSSSQETCGDDGAYYEYNVTFDLNLESYYNDERKMVMITSMMMRQ